MHTMASGVPSVARRAARAGARLLGRVELLHAALVGAAHLTGAKAVALHQAGTLHGLDAEPWLADTARRAALGGETRSTVASHAVAATPVPGVGGLAVAGHAFEDRQVALLGALAAQLAEPLAVWGEGAFWTDDLAALEYGGWGDGIDVGLARIGPEGRVIAANEAARERVRLLEPPVSDDGAASVRVRRDNLLTALSAPGARGRLLVIWDVSDAAPLHALEAQIVSNAAHELRSPLTAIRAHSEILPDIIQADPGDAAAQFLSVIDREAQRMGGLLDDLREALRPDLGSALVHRL